MTTDYQFDYPITIHYGKPTSPAVPADETPADTSWKEEELGAIVRRMEVAMYEAEAQKAGRLPFDELPKETRQRYNMQAQVAFVASGYMRLLTEYKVSKA